MVKFTINLGCQSLIVARSCSIKTLWQRVHDESTSVVITKDYKSLWAKATMIQWCQSLIMVKSLLLKLNCSGKECMLSLPYYFVIEIANIVRFYG